MDKLLLNILGAIVTIIVAFIVGITYMGLDRKITARVQNRYGPPWYQNFLDVFKLYFKKTNIHQGIMQHMGGVFMMVTAVMAVLIVPVLSHGRFFPNLNFKGDLIFLLYIMTFGQLGMALGVGQTGNPNAAIGVTRGLSLMVGYEIPWVLALVALMIQYHTTSIVGLMNVQAQTGHWLMFSSPFAFIAAILAMLGMFGHAPFDIVIAPNELASGPISEHGGKYMGLLMTAGSIFVFAKLTLYVDLFMGGAGNLLTLLIKTFAFFLIPVLYGIVSPRYRTEHAIRYFWGWPSLFGLLAVIQAVFF